MKKNFFLVITVFVLLFYGCSFGQPQSDDKIDNKDKENVIPKDDVPENGKNDVVLSKVTVKNNSSYAVNVYTMSPTYQETPAFTIQANASYDANFPPSETTLGDVFYFEYLIKIGDSVFPFFNFDSSTCYKNLLIKKNTPATLIIDELQSCSTKSAYLLIENNSTADIYVQNGYSLVYPFGNKEYLIKHDGGNSVYEISDDKTAITISNFGLVRIISGTTKYELPISSLERGNVYTLSFSGDNIHLKSVTPFDIDVKKQIWSRENSYKSITVDAMRPAADVKDGSFIAGSITGKINDKNYEAGSFYVKQLDVYGNDKYFSAQAIKKSSERTCYNEDGSVKTDANGNPVKKTYPVKKSSVLDMIQTKDGNILLVIEILFTEDVLGDNTEHILYKFNPATGDPIFVYYDAQFIGENKTLFFREGVQNRIIESAPDVYALAGMVLDYDYGVISPYFAEIKVSVADKSASWKPLTYINPVSDGLETAFTSIYFDGTDYIVCGFEGFNGEYNGAIHKGVVYKIKSDFTYEKLYEKDRYLFLCIDGTSSSKYYICGEEWADVGGRLYGCYLSADMISKNEMPRRYSSLSNKTYCWFNQLCAYSGKVILSGQSSESRDGLTGSEPMVVCFDTKGELQWENHNFSQYTTAFSCFSNAIGTYDLFLVGKDSKGENIKQKIVSADLLGNDTGVKNNLF